MNDPRTPHETAPTEIVKAARTTDEPVPHETAPAETVPDEVGTRPGRSGRGDVGPTDPPAAPHEATGLDLAQMLARSIGRAATPVSSTRRSRLGRRAGSNPAQLSGARPDGRDPALVGEALDRFIDESGWRTDVRVHGVFGRWSSIVGDEVAAHCVPVSFVDGLLRVQTDSTAWATQVRLLAAVVVRRLNEELGDQTLLRIEVLGPDTPSWRRGPRVVRDGRGPRDTYG